MCFTNSATCPSSSIILNPQGSFLQIHTGSTEFNLLNTVASHWQNYILFTGTRSLEPGLTSWTWSPLFNLHFHILEKNTCKIVKYSRKSHPLLELIASKASTKLRVQPCHTPHPCKLPGHQLINYAQVLDTAHLPPLKQYSGDRFLITNTFISQLFKALGSLENWE